MSRSNFVVLTRIEAVYTPFQISSSCSYICLASSRVQCRCLNWLSCWYYKTIWWSHFDAAMSSKGTNNKWIHSSADCTLSESQVWKKLGVGHKGCLQKYRFSDPLSTFVCMWLTPSPCGRPRLGLDSVVCPGSIIGGALKICCLLIWPPYAAQTKDRINRESCKQTHSGSQTYLCRPISANLYYILWK